MLDSLRKLKVSVSADSKQISDKSCAEWTGIGTSSQGTPHIHKQYTARFLMALENEEKRPSIDIILRLVDTLNIPGNATLNPQIQHIDSEDQQLLRQYMRLNDSDKSVIHAVIRKMLNSPKWYGEKH